MENEKQTLGESRVRTIYNPDFDTKKVDTVKDTTAELIDLCETEKQASNSHPTSGGEVARLWSLAQTAYEEAAMWAVKAITHPK